MQLDLIPPHILRDLREVHDDATIAILSPREAFEAYCGWNGIIGWDLWDVAQQLTAAGPLAQVT